MAGYLKCGAAMQARAEPELVLRIHAGAGWQGKGFAHGLGAYRTHGNVIAPTVMETPMMRPIFKDEAFRDSMLAKIKLGRIGQVEDLMGAGQSI